MIPPRLCRFFGYLPKEGWFNASFRYECKEEDKAKKGLSWFVEGHKKRKLFPVIVKRNLSIGDESFSLISQKTNNAREKTLSTKELKSFPSASA